MKVVLCVPTMVKPHRETLESIATSIPLLERAGIEHAMVSEVGCPYISAARATMLRKALDAGADQIVFIDHDVSWAPGDLLALTQAEGDVVAGTYRFKREPEEYMGQLLVGDAGTPIARDDGALLAHSIPAGFLRITRAGVNKFARAHPELLYGEAATPHVDLFNHGAHDGVWYGEDYAFARRWRDKCGQIWVLPDLDLTHWAGETPYPGNFHLFLRRQPGGDLCES